MTDREVCALALTTFGTDNQLRQLQEECAEVVVAVNHLQRGRITVDEFLAECADVEIMIHQARILYGDEVIDRIKAEKIQRLLEKINPVEKPLSLRGEEWAHFSVAVLSISKAWETMPEAKAFDCVEAIKEGCGAFMFFPRKEQLLTIAKLASMAEGKMWEAFSDEVADHIENYTVPQYGDKGKDYASTYTSEYCISQILKYCNRFGTNAREGQQHVDFMKVAHFACLAEDKMEKS